VCYSLYVRVNIFENRLTVQTGYAAREVMKDLPGARWSKDLARWTYPLIYPSALALGWAAGQLGETVQPETQEVVDWVVGQQEAWDILTGASKKLLSDEPVPGWFGHQVQGACWLSMPGAEGGRLDTGETGSGKTATTLRGLWHLWTHGDTRPALVSTLVSVKGGWNSEITRVAKDLPLPNGAQWRAVVLRGTAVQRRKLLAGVAEEVEAGTAVGIVVITNHEQLRMHSKMTGYGDIALSRCPQHGGVREGSGMVTLDKCEAHPKEFNAIPWCAVVFDEAHRLMNPKAKQTRSAWAIADATDHRWGLTGTPGSRAVIENTWGLLRLVSGKDWPPKSSWTAYYAETGYNSMGFWEVGALKTEHEEEFRAAYDALTRRVLKKQVLDLPPLLRGGTLVREIEMSAPQKKAYVEMRDKLKTMTEKGLLTAQNMLVQASRLTGLASATGELGDITVTVDEEGEEHEHIEMNLIYPSNKADAVVDMIKAGDVEPGTVLQFVSRKLLYLVRDKLITSDVLTYGQMGIIAGDVSEAERTKAMALFQAGKIPFFAFTVGAGGTGITLTRAHTMVAVQRPWSSIQHLQAQDRVHRIGSERHEAVTIIDLITPGTVELGQMERLQDNAVALEQIVKDKDRLAELLFG